MLAAFAFLCFAFWWITRPQREEYASYSFAPDLEVRLFIESDLDTPGSLYYEIRQGRRVVVPTTYLGSAPDRGKPLDIRRASSPDGSIAAVWSQPEFTILYHHPSGESWPRLLDDETVHQPAVRAKWRARLAMIRQRHDEIPLPEELSW